MKVSRQLLAMCAGIVFLCASAWAEAPQQPPRVQNLPQTVTVKTDMIFNVPFSVTGDVVPVPAGTEVYVKGAGDGYLKLSYGPGELTVDPVQTDLAERVQTLPQPSLKVPNVSAILAEQRAAANEEAALHGSGGKVGRGSILWIGMFVIVLFLIAAGIWAFKGEIEGYFRPAPQQKCRGLVAFGRPSRADIQYAIGDLDWFQLEKLVAALFEAKGNSVEMRGGANADGGIDLVVDSGSTRAAVQCKHWSKWKCGPRIVRELIGAMKHEGFSQGFLVCRTATAAAVELAAQERINIVDRTALIDRITTALDSHNEEVRRKLFAPDKLCPKCGAQMVRRTAAKGSNAGSEFWGCSKYPDCRQTMRV